MRRLAQRRNPIQMTEFQELVQQTHATATEWQPSTVNPRRPTAFRLGSLPVKGYRRGSGENPPVLASHPPCASSGFLELHCRCVVVGRSADQPVAPADRRLDPARLRLLCAVPRPAEPAQSGVARSAPADCRGSRAAGAYHRLRPHLFGRQRRRSGAGPGCEGGLEGHSRHLAQQRPAEEPPADRRLRGAREGIPGRHHGDRRRQRGAVARRDDGHRSKAIRMSFMPASPRNSAYSDHSHAAERADADISVSIVAAPCLRFAHAARVERPRRPQRRPAWRACSDSHCQLSNCSAGIIDEQQRRHRQQRPRRSAAAAAARSRRPRRLVGAAARRPAARRCSRRPRPPRPAARARPRRGRTRPVAFSVA